MVADSTKSRGSYAKGKARRQEIVDTALSVFAKNGFNNTSMRDIAAKAGLTPAGVLHHFATKEDLFTEVLRQRDERVRGAAGDASESTLLEQTRKVVAYNQAQRGLTSLYAIVSAEATNREHPAHEYFVERYAGGAARAEEVLAAAREAGRIRSDIDPKHAARLVTAVMDGLQQQWLLDDTVDMLASFDEFVRGYLLVR